MPVIERVEREDLILYEVLRNPVLFGEFIYNIDKLENEESFEFTLYQKEILCDFNRYVSICTARATGKTTAISALLQWLLLFKVFPDDYILYTVPNKVHLEPVFTNLIRLFRSNSFIKNFIEPKGGINSSDFKITLLNNAVLHCRIAGQSGTGANVIGLHTPFVAVDEAGYFPHGTFQELQPSLNTWTQGCREMVSGVPTGLRENNILYSVDMENDSYSKHRVSAEQNPRITKEDKQKAIEQYGGEDSDDYIHYFLGQHGKPIFSLFDRASFEIQAYPVYKLEMDGTVFFNDIGSYITKFSLFPAVPDRDADVIFGIDLGYTEPTAITILYLDNYKRIKFHGRIKLTKVSYPIQERLIDLLDTKFRPILIGIDKGSAGISVIQNLLEHRDFVHKDYHKRIVPIDFSSSILLGVDSDGNDIKEKTKPFTVSVLQDYSNNHKLIYSSTDYEMITELERMTYSKSPTGDITYKTLTVRGGKRGEDHFTSALLCGISAYYLNREFILARNERKRLFRPQWIT